MTTAVGANGCPVRTEELKPVMGGGTFHQMFGGVKFVACLLELIKNSRDSKATLINIITKTRSFLRFVDNGNGMESEHRNAFVSVNTTTSSIDNDQSGKFGTGTKHMLYSHCVRVRVVTAPADDPDHIYIFELDVKDYEQKVKDGVPIPSTIFRKDVANWPHGDQTKPLRDRTGTELTYEFADPSARNLTRGKALAEDLSARLPLRFSDIVQVDAEPIPAKRVVGEVFKADIVSKELGCTVYFEIYRPVKKRSEESLFLTSLEVGEAPIDSLYKLLPPELKELYNKIYRLPEVCGVVSAKTLNKFCVEKRDTVNPTILDWRGLPDFIRILESCAAEVQRKLKIRHDEIISNWEETEREDIRSFAADFNETFNESGIQPTVEVDEDPVEEEGTSGGSGRGSGSSKQLSLEYVREVEVGEIVQIKLHIDKEIAGEVDPSKIHWITNRACGKVEAADDNRSISLEAEQVGDGYIRADVPGTPHSARAVYRVVKERKLSLSTGALIHVEVGAEIPIFVRNSDKVKGELVWELRGHGSLREASGARGGYAATHVGTGTVRVWGSDRPQDVVETTFEVKPRHENRELVPICGVWFSMDAIDSESEMYRRPVTMVVNAIKTTLPNGQSVDLHEMKINRCSPGYEQAKRTGRIREYLRDAAACEFPRFKRLDLEGLNLDDLDASEIKELIDIILFDKFQILEEIQRKKASGKKLDAAS